MNKILISLVAMTLMVIAPVTAQLTGTKTINPAGSGSDNFTSFKEAIDTLNAYGVGTGGVRFEIAGGTYSEPPLTVNPTVNLPAADKPILFVVASGGTVILNDTATVKQWAFTIGSGTASVDYVTLDGSNAGGTDRSWTINNAGPDSSNGLLVFGDNVRLKNLVVTLAFPWSKAPAQGIVLHQTGASDNCVIENCDITANYGILVGTSTGTSQAGNLIKNNTIHCWNKGVNAVQSTDLTIQGNLIVGKTDTYPTTTGYAIYASGPTGNTGAILIDRNTIHDFGSNAGTTTAQTIHVVGAYGSAYFTISNNLLYNLYNAISSGTSSLNLTGIYMSSSSGQNLARYEVFNNVVTGFLDNDARPHSGWTSGIRYNTYGGRANIFNNSVYIAQTTQRAHNTAAFIVGTNSTAVTDTVFSRNNIFWVSATGYSSNYKSHGAYKGGSFLGTLVSDYNTIYNDGGGVNSYNAGSISQTLANWIAGQDLHSACRPVSFVDPVNNLHLNGVSVGDDSLTGTPNVGWTVASFPSDIDGDTRNALYPYMGADESSTALAAVGVSTSALDFGNVLLGDSLEMKVYIKSMKRNPVTVTSLSAPTSDFSWTLVVPVTITDSVELAVKFKPHVLGTYSDNIGVTTDFGSVNLALAGTSEPQPLGGNYTIDPAQATGGTNFQTFTEACNVLTTNGVGAPVTITLASGTYNEAAPLVVNPTVNKPASDKTVKFVPATGATVILNVTTGVGDYAFRIGSSGPNSIDYVTLDGSNIGGTDRSWTINSVGPDSSQGVIVYGDHVQIKNLVIALNNPWGNAPSRGLVLHETAGSDSCLVENCDVTANYAILVGTGGATTQTGNIVRNNTVHCLARGIVASQSTDVTIDNNTVIGHSTIYPLVTGYGIYASNTVTLGGTVSICGNTVHDLGTNTGTTPAVTISGIYAGSKAGTYTINANRVYNMFNATSNATTNVQVQGIVLQNGDHDSRYVVSNNFIYGLKDDDATENSNWTAGIRPITGGKVYVFHNTVYVDNTTRAHYVAAFICGGGIDATDTNFVFNNIFYSRQTGFSSGKKSYCIYKGGSFLGTLVSDYNLVYNDGGGSYSSIGSPSGGTFAQWQTSGRDVHGSSKIVSFVDSSSDLHLAVASHGDIALAALALPGINSDFDGHTRSGGVTYMGADEVGASLTVFGLTSAVIDFGSVGVGDSLVQYVYVKPARNIGLIVTGVFATLADYTPWCAVPDTVTDSCGVEITFKPLAQGTFADTVRIVTNAGNAWVSLSGASPMAALVTSVQPIAFGTIKVDSSAVQTVVITNSSVNRLVIDSIYTKTPEFLVDKQNGTILGDTLRVLVAFMPTTIGTFQDTVYIKNNGSTSLVKIPVSGVATSVTGVTDRDQIPHVFSLKQNYPNPFNPSTKVEFTVPSSGRATLRVYNTIGQNVVTLFDGVAEAGRLYTRPFNGSSLPTGMYLVRLQFNDQVATQKMLLVK
ncbi:MAG: choice-of-anchor D domain-containing protein [Bacteroidota bacterium]